MVMKKLRMTVTMKIKCDICTLKLLNINANARYLKRYILFVNKSKIKFYAFYQDTQYLK